MPGTMDPELCRSDPELWTRNYVNFKESFKFTSADQQLMNSDKKEKYLWCVIYNQTHENIVLSSSFIILYIVNNEVKDTLIDLVNIEKKVQTGKMGLSSMEAIRVFNQIISKADPNNLSFKWNYTVAGDNDKKPYKAHLLYMDDITIESEDPESIVNTKGVRYLDLVWDLGSVIRVSISTGAVFRDG